MRTWYLNQNRKEKKKKEKEEEEMKSYRNQNQEANAYVSIKQLLLKSHCYQDAHQQILTR